jgi:hypothetical protein
VQGANIVLFLSYAEEDDKTALEIAKWLGEQGMEVYVWQHSRGGRFITQIEDAINRADAFIALISPHYLCSDWCGKERDLAMQRERDIKAADGPAAAFIHVLKIRDTPGRDAGFLRIYDWVDLTNPRNKEGALDSLASRLKLRSQTGSAGAGPTSPGPGSQSFRNRRDELDRVLRGLNNASGPHFWLVTAPPELGKTWFMRQLSAELASAEPARWVATRVDLRDQAIDVRGDAELLLPRLFGLSSSIRTGPEVLRDIAQQICRSGYSRLCLLDSAELLNQETGRTLRSHLSDVYHLVQQAGNIDVRLALIVASRREEEWRGVTPDPRLRQLALTEFKVDVVQEALHDLAGEMRSTFDAATFQQNAALVHRLSEGLPALLVRCLQWIRTEQWLDMGRLESQDLFEKLAQPYIEQGLLSQDSLVPCSREQPGEPRRRALDRAFRVLAPYRVFTQSHVRHHLASDSVFAEALGDLGWSIEDLWRAISGTALLSRPLNEPWQEIHAAIRRLLYRYFYTSDAHRAEAHREARQFVEVWADRQAGKEQVIGLVECLWHEAAFLRLSQSAEMEEALSESARKLSQALKPSSAYTIAELREYAAERMRNDEEFQTGVGDMPGLFNRLVGVVEAPL